MKQYDTDKQEHGLLDFYEERFKDGGAMRLQPL